MNDHDTKLQLQDAAHHLARMFPGRAFAFFVFPAEPGQRCHYVASAKRSKIIEAMEDMISRGEPKDLPENPSDN